MTAMIPNFHSRAPKGTPVNVFGYSGVVGDGGVIVADVPESLVAGELAAGRMVSVQAVHAQEPEARGEQETPQPTPKKSKDDK